MSPRRVVLLGGGYVTLHAYRTLARGLRRQIRRGDVEIVVLSADDAHSFHGFTGEVLAGMLPLEVTRTPLAEACPRARVVHARATAVDPDRRVVDFEPVDGGGPGRLRYDELVVGVGGREPVDGVTGLAEHGFPLRGPGDIEALTERIHRTLPGGVAAPTDRTVLVVGGGLAGAELAAAIADVGNGRLQVVLAHSGDRLVPQLHAEQPRLATYSADQLDRLGVEVRLDVKVVAVETDGAWLSDGTHVTASTVVATLGQAAVRLPGLEEQPVDGRGRLLTAPDLRVAPGLWAAGDAAHVRHVATGDPVPANALWAIKAGARVGANVARSLRGRPTKRFGYRGLGQAASFGLGRSVAELYGVPFTGAVAWLLRLVFFLRFMPSRRRALRVLGHLLRRRHRAPTFGEGHRADPRLPARRLLLGGDRARSDGRGTPRPPADAAGHGVEGRGPVRHHAA